MSPELIAILTIGVALGGGQLATVRWAAGRFERASSETTGRFERMSNEMADLRERMAQVEGMLDGLRERMARVEGVLDGLRDVVSSRRESA